MADIGAAIRTAEYLLAAYDGPFEVVAKVDGVPVYDGLFAALASVSGKEISDEAPVAAPKRGQAELDLFTKEKE